MLLRLEVVDFSKTRIKRPAPITMLKKVSFEVFFSLKINIVIGGQVFSESLQPFCPCYAKLSEYCTTVPTAYSHF